MDGKTLYTIMVAENLFIVLFAWIYVQQFSENQKDLKRYALSRLLQAINWVVYASFPQNHALVILGHFALTLGITIEGYCLIKTISGERRKVLFSLVGLSIASLTIDLLANQHPQLQSLFGNLITAAILITTSVILAFPKNRSYMQRATGFLVLLRGMLILIASMFLDTLFFEDRGSLKPIFNTIVASVTIFVPLMYLFLLKEKDDEQIRKNRDELLKLNQTKDTLFSVISHDLKGTIGSIVAFLKLQHDELNEENYTNTKEYTSLTLKAATQNFALLENLLDWARFQTNKIGYEPTSLNLLESIEQIRKDFALQLEEKSLELKIEIPVGLTIVADPFMFSAVIRNLISNAIKFSYPNNDIILSAQPDNSWIAITVRDFGIGLKEAQTETLFEIAKNKSNPGTNNESGTGLGLLLCRDFVEKHGGQIKAENADGKGSQFTVTFPAASK